VLACCKAPSNAFLQRFITPFLAMGSFTHIQGRTVLVTELDGLIGVPTRVNLVANINSKTKY
jgi:hypothetical protein